MLCKPTSGTVNIDRAFCLMGYCIFSSLHGIWIAPNSSKLWPFKVKGRHQFYTFISYRAVNVPRLGFSKPVSQRSAEKEVAVLVTMQGT
jgi:hypothetical protein